MGSPAERIKTVGLFCHTPHLAKGSLLTPFLGVVGQNFNISAHPHQNPLTKLLGNCQIRQRSSCTCRKFPKNTTRACRVLSQNSNLPIRLHPAEYSAANRLPCCFARSKSTSVFAQPVSIMAGCFLEVKKGFNSSPKPTSHIYLCELSNKDTLYSNLCSTKICSPPRADTYSPPSKQSPLLSPTSPPYSYLKALHQHHIRAHRSQE